MNTEHGDFAVLDLSAGRRAFLQGLGLGAAGISALLGSSGPATAQSVISAADILNFALNFEYLGYRFYRVAVSNYPSAAQVGPSGVVLERQSGGGGGVGNLGSANGGHAVPFTDPIVKALASEFMVDELAHISFLQSIIGRALSYPGIGKYVNQPDIDLDGSFTNFARFSGLTTPTGTFDAFENETNFLIGAFLLEDVCVTALKGAVPLLRDNEFLEGIAGLLATEAYQAGVIRTLMAERGLFTQAQQVSDLRDYFDGPSDIDQGIGTATAVNIVPSDFNALAFSRTPEQVRNIAYGTTNGQPGGFFPRGINGVIR